MNAGSAPLGQWLRLRASAEQVARWRAAADADGYTGRHFAAWVRGALDAQAAHERVKSLDADVESREAAAAMRAHSVELARVGNLYNQEVKALNTIAKVLDSGNLAHVGDALDEIRDAVEEARKAQRDVTRYLRRTAHVWEWGKR